jgi:hypothetical protein
MALTVSHPVRVLENERAIFRYHRNTRELVRLGKAVD